MSTVIPTIGAIAALCFIWGFGPARPEVPESLKAPASEEVILMGHATGVQIYVCQAESRTKVGLGTEGARSGVDRRNWEADRASLRGTGMEAHRSKRSDWKGAC